MRYLVIAMLLLANLILQTPGVMAYDGEYEYTIDVELLEKRRYEEISRGSHTAIDALVTAYTCSYESTGKYKGHPDFCRTASGKILADKDGFRYVAADNHYYAFGTKLYIEGIGLVIVVDTGGDIVGPNRFDLFVSQEDADLANIWGTRRKRVWVFENYK